jgi:hypothetical protein
MNLLSLLNNFSDLLLKIFGKVKYLLAGLYIRRSTRIEVEKNALEKANHIQKQQIDIAADAPHRPSDVRHSMRADDL